MATETELQNGGRDRAADGIISSGDAKAAARPGEDLKVTESGSRVDLEISRALHRPSAVFTTMRHRYTASRF